MTVWVQEAVAAVSMLIFVASAVFLSVAGDVLLSA
jgi:hypothetical protein